MSSFAISLLALAALPAQSAEPQIARGTVFVDGNGDGQLDAGESGLAGIRISNGSQIVKTDSSGRYEIPVADDSVIFVIKPRGYRTPLNDDKLPQFYYIHKPKGSPTQNFPGVEPTGPLPKAINFPLYKQDEPEQFHAIMFGDPQPRNQEEVNYIAHDVIEELVGTNASFGVTLGDIVFDDLRMMKRLNSTIALLGIPWYNVIGNHDINFDARSRKNANETFESIYGPSYYSFDHGPVHFVVIDNIEWRFDDERGKWAYRGGIGPDQLAFIKNDLALVPDDQLVVLMMHIPITQTHDRHGLYRLIEKRKFSMSISGHTHYHEHVWIKKKDGWQGPKPHHHIINVTVSGSWWSGAKDERGIPHTMMADGAPNGYSILSFDGTKYSMEFKAAGRSRNYQMSLHAPEAVKQPEAARASVFANVFNGDEQTKVEMRIGGGSWSVMKQVREIDPQLQSIFDREAAVLKKDDSAFRGLSKPKASGHLWRASLPVDTKVGTHFIEVKATKEDGRVYKGRRVIRVTK